MGRRAFFELPQEFDATRVKIGDEDPVYAFRKARRAMALVQISRLCQIYKQFGDTGFDNDKDRRKWKNILQQRRDAGSIGGPARGNFITAAFKLFESHSWNEISQKHQTAILGITKGGQSAGSNLRALRQRVHAGIHYFYFYFFDIYK